MYSQLENQEHYVRSMPNHLKASIGWYTGGNFDEFNTFLREGKELPNTHQQHLENISTAFYNSPPLTKPLVVYKGIDGVEVRSDKSFVSTSIDYNKSLLFSGAKCCVVQITVSSGSRILPIRSISREPDEDEVLLDRDGTMLITGSTIKDQMKVIFATYIPKGAEAVTEEKGVNSDKFNPKLIVERIIDFFKDDEDLDFVDEDEISLMYKKISGRHIQQKDLQKIMMRLGIVF